ncbi:MAG: hypothetical protein HC895_01395 [Leptolyngbyaceae cyanobacterium SM1_3_5]|nr:hypothetical protein [Leptolyngbyaceae cyanobacterium SM1_3_5]
MAQSITMSEFQPSANVIELPIATVREAAPEAATPTPDVRPKSSGEIASDYAVTDRAVQNQIKVVLAAYSWINPEALKIGKSNKTRYTPLCQELLAQYRASNLSAEDWIAAVHAANPDKVSAPTASTEAPSIEPEVLPQTAPDSEPSSAIATVPKSHIQLLDEDQQDELALLHATYVKPEPTKTFQSIELNGDQKTILEGLKILHSTVSEMKSENDRIKADTAKRKTDTELANAAMLAIVQEGKKAIEENGELVAEAQSVQGEEADAKKRLVDFLKRLGELSSLA